jgi:hypothetical protein
MDPPSDPRPTFPPSQASTGARRRSRGLRWLLLLPLLPLAALLLLVLLLPDRRLEGLLSEGLGAQLGTPVSLRLSRSGLGVWELDSLRIDGDRAGQPFLRLGRLGLYARPATLLGRRLSLDSLLLEDLELSLAWEDGLRLPAWLDSLLATPADTASVEPAAPTGAGEALAWLRPLVRAGLAVDSTRILVRGLRLRLQGHDQGRPVDLAGPPLDLSLRLPRLGREDLAEIAEGRIPGRLLAGALLGWSGTWLDAARQAGEGLRPLPLPSGLRDPLQDAGLGLSLRETLAQRLELRLSLAQDTLRLQGRVALNPSELALLQGGQPLPLPAAFASRLQLDWPLREAGLRLSSRLDWSLSGPGLQADGGLGMELSQPDSLWQLALRLDQRASGESIAAWLPPSFAGDGLEGSATLELHGDLRLRLDAAFTPLDGAIEEHVVLRLPQLSWAAMGLELDSLAVEQRLVAGLQADSSGLWPLDADLSARLDLGRILLADEAGTLAAGGIDAVLQVRGGALEDSLQLAFDGSVARLFGTRLDASATLRLPPPRVLAAAAGELAARPEGLLQVPLQLLVESGRLPLADLDPTLEGGLRLSLEASTVRGRLRLGCELIPDGLQWIDGEEVLTLPLHRAGLFGDLLPLRRADGSWSARVDGLRLVAEPLEPGRLELRERAGGSRLRLGWSGLRLERLLALVPAVLLPEGLPAVAGRLELEALVDFAPDWSLAAARTDLRWEEGRVAIEGYGLDALALTATVDWAADSLRFRTAGRLGSLEQTDPPWSWQGLEFGAEALLALPLDSLLADAAGWLNRPGTAAPLRLEGRFAAPAYGLAASLAAAGPDWRNPWGLGGRAGFALGTPGLVRPWPDLELRADLACELEIEALGGGALQLGGRAHGRLDSLGWAGLAALEGLHLELPFSQALRVAADGSLHWPPPVGRPPLDWNALRAMDRDQPPAAIGALAAMRRRDVRGWALRIDHLAWEEWQLHEFAADLRLADGRLDCPEFRLQAFAGDLRGSFRVEDWSRPSYRLDAACIGLDSRWFRFNREDPRREAQAAGRRGRRTAEKVRLDALLHLEGRGIELDAVEELAGRLQMPALGPEVTLNLLVALDARGVDPSIGRIRRLLELPGFKYRVEAVDFRIAHGFVRPQVALRKSPFSPLPDVTVPMSPLPLGFLVKNFALAEEDPR